MGEFKQESKSVLQEVHKLRDVLWAELQAIDESLCSEDEILSAAAVLGSLEKIESAREVWFSSLGYEVS